MLNLKDERLLPVVRERLQYSLLARKERYLWLNSYFCLNV